MRVIVFHQEPDMEIDGYVKEGYKVFEGEFESEQDIIEAYMEHFNMDKDFWPKLKIIPVELTEDMKLCLPSVDFGFVIDSSKRTVQDTLNRLLYEVTPMKKLVEYKTKNGEIVPVPEDYEMYDIDEKAIVLAVSDSASDIDLVEIMQTLSNATGRAVVCVSNDVQFMVLEEVRK